MTVIHNPRYILPEGMCFWMRILPDGSMEAVEAPAGVVPGKPIDPISLRLEIADASLWQPAWTVDHLKGKLQSELSKEQYERSAMLWEGLRALLNKDQDIFPDESKHLLWKMEYVEKFFQRFHETQRDQRYLRSASWVIQAICNREYRPIKPATRFDDPSEAKCLITSATPASNASGSWIAQTRQLRVHSSICSGVRTARSVCGKVSSRKCRR